MNRVFGKKKTQGPPPPSLGEASAGVGNHIDGMDGTFQHSTEESSHASRLCSHFNVVTANLTVCHA